MTLAISELDPPDGCHRPRSDAGRRRSGRAVCDHRRAGRSRTGVHDRGPCVPERAAHDGGGEFRRPRGGAGQEPAAPRLPRRVDVAADRRRQRLPRIRDDSSRNGAGDGMTWIGDRNMFMIGSHLGHDVQVGNDCTVVNNALVAGHVIAHDGCILSGQTAIQQRVRVGRLAMLGGMGSIHQGHSPIHSPAGTELRHRA